MQVDKRVSVLNDFVLEFVAVLSVKCLCLGCSSLFTTVHCAIASTNCSPFMFSILIAHMQV